MPRIPRHAANWEPRMPRRPRGTSMQPRLYICLARDAAFLFRTCVMIDTPIYDPAHRECAGLRQRRGIASEARDCVKGAGHSMVL